MGLNIKNEETHRLIQELASLTGENLTVAVTEAVREKLHRLRREEKPLAERLRAISEDCAKRVNAPFRAEDIGDLLYDEKGLPR